MQVVYSGGSTPSPSPRLQRKTGYGRPIMPGYMTHVHPQILVQRSREKLTEGDTTLRDSIPAMSQCVATLCLILNIILPGSGTLTAGLSVLCCSHVRPKGDSKGHCIWVNGGVALLQFVLTFLFLLGWIWSIMWGVAFFSVSKKFYNKRRDEDGKQKQRDLEKANAKMHNLAKPRNLPADSSNCNSNSNDKKQTNTQTTHHDQSKENSNQQDLTVDHNRLQQPSTSTTSTTPNASPNSGTPRLNGYSKVPDSFEMSSEVVPRQPIIVLQRASLRNTADNSELDATPSGPTETIMKARGRHMKILQRKMSDNDLSPFVLTHQQLEAIVIHDMPINAPVPRQDSMNRDLGEGLPKT